MLAFPTPARIAIRYNPGFLPSGGSYEIFPLLPKPSSLIGISGKPIRKAKRIPNPATLRNPTPRVKVDGVV